MFAMYINTLQRLGRRYLEPNPAPPTYSGYWSQINTPLGPFRLKMSQITYLMHLAKKYNAAYCGGPTDAVYLTNGNKIDVIGSDVVFAEGKGPLLDELLAITSSGIIGKPDDPVRFAKMMETAVSKIGSTIRDLKFHSFDG